MNIIFFFGSITNLLFVFVVLIPRSVAGFQFALVHHPFDSFKARRKFHSGGMDEHRFGTPPMVTLEWKPVTRSLLSFSRITVTATKPGRWGGSRNQTQSDKNNTSIQEVVENAVNTTNSSSINTTVSSPNKTESETTTSMGDSKSKTYRGSLLGSYFSFLDQSQSSSSRENSPIYSAVETGDTSNNSNNRNNNNNSATALLNKQANETITVADLEVMLAQMQSVSSNPITTEDRRKAIEKDRSVADASGSEETEGSKTPRSMRVASTSSASSSSSSQVAFPQPSSVSDRGIQRGTGIAGCFLGMIIGFTILPNLWLLGMVAGVLYGYEITKDLSEDKQTDKNIVANFLISCGTQLASVYLKILDGVKALWFLYKTGQLSYEYYKTYETLDRKFAIQSKVDAWNTVFVEGKRKFDAWEEENEVGRKVLAGLRTAWLLDEESRKRAAGRSRYRLVQVAYDLKRSASKLFKRSIQSIRSLFDEEELQAFWNGLRSDFRRKGSMATRWGAIGVALVAVNVGGALFSLSAVFSNLLAIVGALIWPSWASDLLSRTQEIGFEIKERGFKADRNASNNKAANPFECIQRKYEEYSSDKMKQSKRNQQSKRRRKPLPSKRKRRPAKSKRTGSLFGLDYRRKSYRRGAEVGTWGNFKRTR